MDKQLNFLYDHAADVLHISVGHPIFSDSAPLNNEIILQIDPTTQKIVGFSIVDFIKCFANHEEPRSVPLGATFERLRSSTKQKRAVPHISTKHGGRR